VHECPFFLPSRVLNYNTFIKTSGCVVPILHSGFLEIKREYIFPIIEKKVFESQKKDLLNLGIGDVALPLVEPAAIAFKEAIDEMQKRPIGYPASHGHFELRQKIHSLYFEKYGLDLTDIFISDGINSDLGDLQEIFSQTALFGVHDPSYPVPQDVCLMAGRSKYLHVLPTSFEMNFLPEPPDYPLDCMYLCTPNNPSGTAMTKDQLAAWVKWAIKHQAILIVDAAYSDFITQDDVPQSIYQIEGAKQVAIELRSFSKSAGFTGLRVSYSCVPSTLLGLCDQKNISFKKLWAQRMASKSNGISYPAQKAALACLTEEGLSATLKQVHHYLLMARRLKDAAHAVGLKTLGADNAPYVFIECPQGFSSWEFFDYLLDKCAIVSVPGLGFGQQGDHFIRLSGFIGEDVCQRACERLTSLACFV